MSRLLQSEVSFVVILIAVQLAAFWLARRVRARLSGPTAAPPPLDNERRSLSYRAPPTDDEAPTVHDLAYLLGVGGWPAFGALCGLIHRQIVEVRGNTMSAGPTPLPPDATAIERSLVPSEGRVPVSDALQAAALAAAPFHEARLRQWGLLIRPSTDQVARFAAGCVALTPFAFAMAKVAIAPLGWVSMLLLAFMAYRFRLLVRPGALTMRGTRLVAEASGVLSIRAAERESWPASSEHADTVIVASAVMGAPVLGTPVLGDTFRSSLGPGTTPRAAPPSRATVEDLIAKLGPTPPRVFAAMRLRSLVQVPLLGLGTCAALLWAGMTLEPVDRRPRRGAHFVHPSRPTAGRVPAPVRGKDLMNCALPPEQRQLARQQASERSVFSALAKVKAMQPEPTQPRDPKHSARPGQIYAISRTALYEVEIDADGLATSRALEPLAVHLPTRDRYQLRRRDRLAPKLASITISDSGGLYLLGDSRIYICSPSTSACSSRGVVPFGMASVAYVPGTDARFVGFDSRGASYEVEMLGAPRWLQDATNDMIAKTELCVDRHARADPRFELLGNPAAGHDGRLYAAVYDVERSGTRLATVDPDWGVATPFSETISNSPLAAWVVGQPDRTLLITRTGALWSYDADRAVFRRVGQTSFEIIGAAAFFGPATPATTRPSQNPETP